MTRPQKEQDRPRPLVENQEYAYAYYWEHRRAEVITRPCSGNAAGRRKKLRAVTDTSQSKRSRRRQWPARASLDASAAMDYAKLLAAR